MNKARSKKSFIAYNDWYETFKELSDDEAGQLAKVIFKFVNGLDAQSDNKIIKMAFIPIKQSLERDVKKYDAYLLKQSTNGKLGGRPPKKPKEPTGFSDNPSLPKKADSVSDSDSASASANITEEDILLPYNQFIDEIKNRKHDSTIDIWYKEFKIKRGSLASLLDNDFKGQLLTDEKVHDNTLEVKKHFKSWLNVMDNKGKLKQLKIKSIGSL